MKKVLFAVLVAGSLAACNNTSETTTAPDTTVVTPVETVPVPVPGDTTTIIKTDSVVVGDTATKM